MINHIAIPINVNNINQTIGKTIFGGASGGNFKLLYVSLTFPENKLESKPMVFTKTMHNNKSMILYFLILKPPF